MLLSNCTMCNYKKSRFIKEKEANELSSLEIKTPESEISLVGPLLF